jgi:hypothetical protein
MTKISYIAVCAVAALGFSFVSPKAAYAFPAAPGADKTYAQTVSGNEAISVRWGGRGWGARGVGFRHGVGWRRGYGGWGGYGLHGVGWRRGYGGWGGYGWRGVGWRRGYGGWGGYGWGRPVGLGVGLAAASTYPYYGSGYGAGYYSGYPAYSSGCGW